MCVPESDPNQHVPVFVHVYMYPVLYILHQEFIDPLLCVCADMEKSEREREVLARFSYIYIYILSACI